MAKIDRGAPNPGYFSLRGQLQVGDYVVHRAHGIGIYNGVTTLSIAGVLKDFLLISYLGSDKIYVPVEKIGTIFKYSDGDGVKPSINSLID